MILWCFLLLLNLRFWTRLNLSHWAVFKFLILTHILIHFLLVLFNLFETLFGWTESFAPLFHLLKFLINQLLSVLSGLVHLILLPFLGLAQNIHFLKCIAWVLFANCTSKWSKIWLLDFFFFILVNFTGFNSCFNLILNYLLSSLFSFSKLVLKVLFLLFIKLRFRFLSFIWNLSSFFGKLNSFSTKHLSFELLLHDLFFGFKSSNLHLGIKKSLFDLKLIVEFLFQLVWCIYYLFIMSNCFGNFHWYFLVSLFLSFEEFLFKCFLRILLLILLKVSLDDCLFKFLCQEWVHVFEIRGILSECGFL